MVRPARPERRLLPALAVALVLLGACGAGTDEGGGDPAGGAGSDGAGSDGTGSDGEVQAVDVDRGQRLFDANCAACHGPAASGTAAGPPLVHEIYEPGHHSDESFQLAVARGSTQHHWDFGPMPAIPGLERDEVADITAYVRDLQREAGIID